MQSKTSLRTASVPIPAVLALLALTLAPPLSAAPIQGETSIVRGAMATFCSWVASLSELVLPAESQTVDEAGVDIEPNG